MSVGTSTAIHTVSYFAALLAGDNSLSELEFFFTMVTNVAHFRCSHSHVEIVAIITDLHLSVSWELHIVAQLAARHQFTVLFDWVKSLNRSLGSFPTSSLLGVSASAHSTVSVVVGLLRQFPAASI